MKCYLARPRALFAASALCLLAAPYSRSQTAPAPAGTASDQEDEAVVLSPFIVDASADENRYRANSTLAGTRVRTDLKDVASAISVVTQQFLQDTGAKNNADLLVYTPSTEVAGIRGNFTGAAGAGIYQENTVTTSTRVRGLDSADNTRDYFLTDIPWDGFNVGRVDLQRGPNSILFGTGSPAGIINTSTNEAGFKTAYNFENRVDEYGSLRNSVNLNQVLIKDVLSIRIAALKDDEKYEQKPAFKDDARLYAAIRFDPKIFGEGNRTSIRAKYEDGKIRSNNPRQLPPVDTITPWFKSGTDQYGNLGFNKLTINQFNPMSPNPSGVPLPGGKGGPLGNATYSLGSNQGRSYWPDIINYYEATPKGINTGGVNPVDPSGTPIKTIAAQANIGFGLRDSGGNTLGGVFPGFLPMAIPSMSQYARTIGTLTSTYPTMRIPGGVYFADVVLTDPSIFNFYEKLLDGPNKREWQNWEAYNIALEQSFLNDRLAFLFAFDHQRYDSGANPWLQGQQYAINVDVNETFADGTPNPNVGRPYIATAASAPGQNQASDTTRDSFRVTPTGEVRASDVLGDTRLAKILGRHVFTGLYERNLIKKENVTWAQFATTPDYIIDNSPNENAANTLGSNRSFEWLAYLGPDMRSKSSASGANLSNLNYMIEPPKSQTAVNFNSHWNRATTPSDPNYVDPTAPFTYTNFATGATVTGTQRDNPANYIGWSPQKVDWMRASDPSDYPSLVQSASRTRYRDISTGITWQGYFLDGDLVPTVGWRKDVITNYQTNALTEPNSGFTSLNYEDNYDSRTDVRGESKTWGVVYHLPKALTSKLPFGTTVSGFYNNGSNFKADASRLSLAGLPIPNAKGHTREYGIVITTMDDKLSLKVAKFKTKVQNATLNGTSGNSIGGLGSEGYFLADGAIWGYGWATALQDGLRGQTPGTNYYDYATADGFTRDTPANSAAADSYNLNGGTSPNGTNFIGGKAIIDAWLNAPFPSTFFSSYALTPDIDHTKGAASGNLRDSYSVPPNNANGPITGGGSSFGNHQTTVDNLSNGTEIELTYQPVKNWNITMNYSKVFATHENIDPVSKQFIGAMTKFMNGPGGQVREWFNGGGTLGAQWNSSIVAPYTVQLNALGHQAPEVSPWRFNVVTTYMIDQGPLKNVFIGGAFREEAGRIIGYKFDPTFKNANSDDPDYAGVTNLTLGGLDVNQPFTGENEHHFDAWVGYSRKITRDINWRIQLNVRHVGENNRLMAARINPDGSIALARIVQGMGFQLTNSFDF
jgi:outer membrane receptor protein involved in Fe transport